MAELFVPLRMTPGLAGIYLKQACGRDEIAVEDINTKTALELLKGLIKGNSKDSKNSFNMAKIVTADRDRILAQLYISIYGSKVESTLHCENCERLFDLDFSLDDLLNHYPLESNPDMEHGAYQSESGSSFRLPTGEDELLAAAFSPMEAENFLLNRCLVKGDLKNDQVSIQEKMSEIAPVLNLDMHALCPDCGHEQQVQFDMQSFLLMRLKQERPRLIHEIHSIAINYHWPHDVILDLPRNLRKQYAALINSES